jgi:hypothetical protein
VIGYALMIGRNPDHWQSRPPSMASTEARPIPEPPPVTNTTLPSTHTPISDLTVERT